MNRLRNNVVYFYPLLTVLEVEFLKNTIADISLFVLRNMYAKFQKNPTKKIKFSIFTL